VKSIFEPGISGELIARLNRLTPDRKPLWGKMNVNQMVVHCTRGFEMMIGELKVSPKPGPFRFAPLRYLIIHVLPWPKGAPTAPELIPPADPGDFAANLAKLRTMIERIAAWNPEGPFTPHAAFGDIKGDSLGVLGARHVDHHFRQFGA
jgi:hypothetical protein